MTMNDTLSSAMSAILNSDKVGKLECAVSPSSKLIKKVLDILKESGYIESYKEIEHASKQSLVINLSGKINKCGAIKPRFAIPKDGYEKYEKRYLIGKDFGILVVSTSKGIMTHLKAKEKKIGGKLIAYCY